jgi:hypothetical protein
MCDSVALSLCCPHPTHPLAHSLVPALNPTCSNWRDLSVRRRRKPTQSITHTPTQRLKEGGAKGLQGRVFVLSILSVTLSQQQLRKTK